MIALWFVPAFIVGSIAILVITPRASQYTELVRRERALKALEKIYGGKKS